MRKRNKYYQRHFREEKRVEGTLTRCEIMLPNPSISGTAAFGHTLTHNQWNSRLPGM